MSKSMYRLCVAAVALSLGESAYCIWSFFYIRMWLLPPDGMNILLVSNDLSLLFVVFILLTTAGVLAGAVYVATAGFD